MCKCLSSGWMYGKVFEICVKEQFTTYLEELSHVGLLVALWLAAPLFIQGAVSLIPAAMAQKDILKKQLHVIRRTDWHFEDDIFP